MMTVNAAMPCKVEPCHRELLDPLLFLRKYNR